MKILIFIALVALCLVAYRYSTRQRQAATSRGSNADSTSDSMSDSMDVAKARAVLGLDDTGLNKDAVVSAHRKLMQHIHPDKGGSALLAQQLNEAKRVLLSHL